MKRKQMKAIRTTSLGKKGKHPILIAKLKRERKREDENEGEVVAKGRRRVRWMSCKFMSRRRQILPPEFVASLDLLNLDQLTVNRNLVYMSDYEKEMIRGIQVKAKNQHLQRKAVDNAHRMYFSDMKRTGE